MCWDLPPAEPCTCACHRLVAPVLLRGLLRWLRGNAAQGYGVYPLRQGWMYASLLAISGFILALIHHQLFWCGLNLPRPHRWWLYRGHLQRSASLSKTAFPKFQARAFRGDAVCFAGAVTLV